MRLLPLPLLLIAALGSAADIAVTGAYARATAPTAANGAVFATLGGGPDTLVGATSDAADQVEIHEVVTLPSGARRMQPVASVAVPGVLKPGGRHLMLIGLKKPLTEKFAITVRLIFATGKPLDIVVPIGAIDATEPPAGAEPACCRPE